MEENHCFPQRVLYASATTLYSTS